MKKGKSRFSLGDITGFLGYLKTLFDYLASVIVKQVAVEGKRHKAIQHYIWENCKKGTLGEDFFSTKTVWVRDRRSYKQILVHEMSTEIPELFWYGLVPLIVSSEACGEGSVQVSYIRGTLDIDNFLKKAVNSYDEFSSPQDKAKGRARKRYEIVKVGNHNGGSDKEAHSELIDDNMFIGTPFLHDKAKLGKGYPTVESEIEKMCLDKTQKELVSEVRKWRNNKKWYMQRHIPWRRGYAFYGLPGTGKTSLVKAMAHDFDLPVYVYDLNILCNQDLMHYWEQMQPPCVAVFEDIDSVFKQRDNVSETSKVTFDCLLQCLDGLDSLEGVLTVITTNKVDSLDSALGGSFEGVSGRPGRIDRSILFSYLDDNGKKFLANRILDDKMKIESVLSVSKDETPAQFRERCYQEVDLPN